MSNETKELPMLEIVKKLIGPIIPVGESNTDSKRFENLQEMCFLVNQLVIAIDDVACNNNGRHEASMHKAGQYACDFLTNTLGIKE